MKSPTTHLGWHVTAHAPHLIQVAVFHAGIGRAGDGAVAEAFARPNAASQLHTARRADRAVRTTERATVDTATARHHGSEDFAVVSGGDA